MMSHQQPSDAEAIYQITIKGHLACHWSTWLGDLTVTYDEHNNTVLAGPVADQAALHGLLIKVRDLGVVLLRVERVEPEKDKIGPVRPNLDFAPDPA